MIIARKKPWYGRGERLRFARFSDALYQNPQQRKNSGQGSQIPPVRTKDFPPKDSFRLCFHAKIKCAPGQYRPYLFENQGKMCNTYKNSCNLPENICKIVICLVAAEIYNYINDLLNSASMECSRSSFLPKGKTVRREVNFWRYQNEK